MRINLVALVLLVLACNKTKKDIEITVTKLVIYNGLEDKTKELDVSSISAVYYLLIKNNTDRTIELQSIKHKHSSGNYIYSTGYEGFAMTHWAGAKDTIHNRMDYVLYLQPQDTATHYFTVLCANPYENPPDAAQKVFDRFNKNGRSGKLWYRNAQNQDTFETYFFNIPIFYTTNSELYH